MTYTEIQNDHTLTPAYGRDYTKRAEALADFRANKDFLWAETPGNRAVPVNLEQIPAQVVRLRIRYARLKKVFIIVRDTTEGYWKESE